MPAKDTFEQAHHELIDQLDTWFNLISRCRAALRGIKKKLKTDDPQRTEYASALENLSAALCAGPVGETFQTLETMLADLAKLI